MTETERHQVFASYGIPYSQHDNYELDHLVPLELGGDNAEADLWPELGQIPNVKDHLENVLHDDVCSGRVSLATAQQAIATDWPQTYLTYLGSVPTTTATAGNPVARPPSAPGTTPAPPHGAWCSASARRYRGSDYDVYVHSNQSHTEATASDSGDRHRYRTNGSGYADIYLWHTRLERRSR
ncbi:MAG TPA: hypothetical protein VE152_09135 [Acidimicrobiales bacterium]|nr:hypothetical protein [Acidimicrobiales bacterium]